MRKPLNHKYFRISFADGDSQPMLMRRRRFRYDDVLAAESPRSDFDPDFDSDGEEFDMEVTSTGAIGGTNPVRPTQSASASGIDAAAPRGLEAPQDEVRISSAAQALSQLDAASQLHEARLAEIRAAIADGSYETLDKLDAAVDRLIEALRAGQQ
ncbi:MAG: flagellar biosynthesis anti-sigma factor FlgM [Planctomycetaceae bacterium]